MAESNQNSGERTQQQQPAAGGGRRTFQAPTGTRDFYPAELNRLRYIQKAWRETSIRHGFEEIDGPTFEHLELYTVKSGEGIVSELFSFERFGGEKTYALRPEFTPTLARMYAARANALPKPTKWFWMQNCFRAERPQRGRLREFYQWNVDLIGDDSVEADAEVIACCIGALECLGLSPNDVTVHISDRTLVSALLTECGVHGDQTSALMLLDRRAKLPAEEVSRQAAAMRFDIARFDERMRLVMSAAGESKVGVLRSIRNEDGSPIFDGSRLRPLGEELHRMGLADWCRFDFSIVRGLAYYTGVVFEVLASGERAVAGGGRYDGLIQLFGGPPTPAVGFGMGDVVLSLVLQDKRLMPSDEEIADRLGLRPDVFVIGRGSEAADAAVAPLVARLRREGLHARRSYKATKNVGKLLKEAAACGARVVAFVEADGMSVTLERLEDGAKQSVAGLEGVAGAVRGLIAEA